MFKKEYFLVFTLIGLAFVYALLSVLVFVTRGRWGRMFHKKLAVGATIVAFCALLNAGNPVFGQVSEPSLTPTPLYGVVETPTPTPAYGTLEPAPEYGITAGVVRIVPENQTVATNQKFLTEIRFGTGTQAVASYKFFIFFDESMMYPDESTGNSGVVAGSDGYISAISISMPGTLLIQGFDPSGTGPGDDLHFLDIHWTAGINTGSTIIEIDVDELADESLNTIGSLTSIAGNVTITELLLGDVNNDGSIDIVDALLVAQEYVTLHPENFNPDAADVDANGQINIIDALLIAQYYVGLIDEF